VPAIWGPTRERQFKHIVQSCAARKNEKLGPCKTTKCKQRRVRDCRRMAGATVNKTRSAQCETRAGCPPRH
jgi:hypothetical protein